MNAIDATAANAMSGSQSSRWLPRRVRGDRVLRVPATCAAVMVVNPANQSPVWVNADQKSGPGGGNQSACASGGNQAEAMKRSELLPQGGAAAGKLTLSYGWCGAPVRVLPRIGWGYEGVLVLSVRRYVLPLAIAFAAAGCWSLVSTTVVLMGLR